MKKQLYILSDGKPGHLNQSLGIAQFLDHDEVEIIQVKSRLEMLHWFKGQLGLKHQVSHPLIIGAGSKTQLWLILAKYVLGYKSVVLMKPNYPMFCFDLCLIPEHDYLNHDVSRLASHVYLTKGAPNKIAYTSKKRKSSLLFLIGGPSKAYDLFPDSLLDMIQFLTTQAGGKTITLTTSRRTPESFINKVKALDLDIEVIDGKATKPEWLPEQLAKTEQVWVTEDSVSMVYEALSSGAKVGLLPMAKLRKSSRVAQGLELLINEGYLTTYMDYIGEKSLTPAPKTLQEARRCAAIIAQVL